VASPSYAALVARVADLEQRLAAALERGAPAGEWATPPFPPPPPPPVEVRPVAQAQLARGDGRLGDGRLGDRRYGAADLEELADRLTDIERRLARIEAELGALR
jgi:hypothetical protein